MAEDAFTHDRHVKKKREHIARQEQTIAHLAASGRSTTRAEKRLMTLCLALDAMLQRRRSWAEGQGRIAADDAAPLSSTPGQPRATTWTARTSWPAKASRRSTP